MLITFYHDPRKRKIQLDDVEKEALLARCKREHPKSEQNGIFVFNNIMTNVGHTFQFERYNGRHTYLLKYLHPESLSSADHHLEAIYSKCPIQEPTIDELIHFAENNPLVIKEDKYAECKALALPRWRDQIKELKEYRAQYGSIFPRTITLDISALLAKTEMPKDSDDEFDSDDGSDI